MSKSADGLQNCLDKLNAYSKTWGLSINIKKTKTMIFNRSNRFIRNQQFYIEKSMIEAVNQYTYVGGVFTPNGKFKQNQIILKNKAMKALFSIKKSILCEKMLNPKLCLKLFDCLIVPILSYCSEVWGTEITSVDNCLESLCMSYLRFILGVSTRTPFEGIRSELGRFPCKIKLNMSVIRFWCRLNSLPGDHILKNALRENIQISSPWAKFVLYALGSYNHCNVFSTFEVKSYSQLCKKLKQEYENEYLENWKSTLFNDSRKNGSGNKLRTYRIFKTKFGFEKYLGDISDFRLRRSLTKYRLSDHNLRIEIGRKCKPHLPLCERICLRCDSNVIDDEFHFLFTCKSHISERSILCQKSGTDFSINMSIEEKIENMKKVMELNYLNLAIFIRNSGVC